MTLTSVDAGRLLDELIARDGPPKSQKGCCLFAARVAIMICGVPENDLAFVIAATHLARGLFSPEFETNEVKRLGWIDMCETALREAAGSKDWTL